MELSFACLQEYIPSTPQFLSPVFEVKRPGFLCYSCVHETAVWQLLLAHSSPCPHAATTSPSRASAVPSAMSTMSGYGGNNDGDSDQVCTSAASAPSVHRRLVGFLFFIF